MAVDFEKIKKEDCRAIARRLGLELNQQDKARCFLHAGDKNPSLQIYGDGWKCFGCGEHGDAVDLVAKYRGVSTVEAAEWIMREMGIREPTRKESSKGHGVLEREHIYPGGQLKHAAYRLADGGKSMPWYSLEKGEWVPFSRKKHPGYIPPLYYRRDNITPFVFLVEGEKDVDRLEKNQKAAISLPDGKDSKWYSEYQPYFSGRNVYIIQDNDEPGKQYAQRMAATLREIATSVHVLDLTQVWPDLPAKGDISDLLDYMGDDAGILALLRLAKDAPEWEPEKEPDIFDSFGFYSVPDLTEEERRPPEFIIEGIIPCGLTVLSGAPKIRKTFMALQMAISVATGQPFLGHNTTKCDVAYLDLEGSKSRVSFRTERMSTKIPRNVYITNTIKERLADGLVDKLRQLHRARPSIRLIIIDTYSRARGSYKSFGVNAYDADVALLEPIQRMSSYDRACLESQSAYAARNPHKRG